MTKDNFDSFYYNYGNNEKWIKHINDFVYKVLLKYSQKITSFCDILDCPINNRIILPIGFLPSNILSNWILTDFDNAIIEQWNPVYYGRYVDDIIIVDKVEKNSPLYRQARAKTDTFNLSSDNIIKMFLNNDRVSILSSLPSNNKNSTINYIINKKLLKNKECHVEIQNSKVKVFYFQSGATQALLKCFQTQIARNVSEFRLMPDMDRVIYRKDYSEIFNLKSNDSINKLRCIDGINIDKFSLSKFLGKYRKVCSLINDKKEENEFERDLMMILDERILIENYGLWERILEILVVNNRIKLLENFSLRVLSSIKNLKLSISSKGVSPEKILTTTKDSLTLVFYSALCRTTALLWNSDINKALEKIINTINSKNEIKCSQYIINLFNEKDITKIRRNYCKYRMINKYVIPMPIDCLLNKLCSENNPNINFCTLSENLGTIDSEWFESKKYYHYYPYMFTPQEISFGLLCTGINKGKLYSPLDLEEKLKEIYLKCNFPNVNSDSQNQIYELKNLRVCELKNDNIKNLKIRDIEKYIIYIGKNNNSDYTGKLCIAVGNAKLYEKNFESVLTKKPNRSYQRYRYLSKILDSSIEQNVDLLVLPENYLPLEWLPTVARFCANNELALITGLEHIVFESSNPVVYNLTAIILPFKNSEQKSVHVFYHSKVNFSPEEKRKIEGYHYSCKEGSIFQLFCWRGIWFPVYCCFELASIKNRTLFNSYADMIIAVEWNKDITYFSNIIESMTRDLHCYCVQSNSSGLGDSRILQPTKRDIRDIIKTKGGKNPCILATDINIEELRKFQMLNYTLQKDYCTFKPTPPDFDREILEKKQNNTLYQWLENNN